MPFGLTVPCRSAEVVAIDELEPVDTAGEDAATATPAVMAIVATNPASSFSVLFIPDLLRSWTREFYTRIRREVAPRGAAPGSGRVAAARNQRSIIGLMSTYRE